LRKTILALVAIALTGTLSPNMATARGGFGKAGFHGGGGGWHGGFGGGGFRGVGFAGGSGWRGGGWGWRGAAYGAVGVGLGLGLASSYYQYGYEYDYPYGYGEYAEYGPWAYRCYLAQQRVWTGYGWRWRVVQVCD
jgi:hypothetical protein